MLNKIKLLLAVLFITTSLFSQKKLRDFVVIVKPVYHETTISFLKSLSEYARQAGYSEAAEYLKIFSEGNGFGSGFLVKGPDGKVYILTNRHVVLQAEKVNIEFNNSDGSKVSYDNCEILSIDYNSDLALIAFPHESNITRALELSTNDIDDGREVFSAGFPGMAGKPSWQLGKGIVSNTALSMSLIDEEFTTVAIQHTAQIDRGSSGGPLLISDTTSSSGYKAIGLNTWKMEGRENVNIAIPVKDINAFILASLSKQKIDTNAELEITSKEFINDALNGYRKVIKYVSYNYVSSLYVENFVKYLRGCSEEAGKDIVKVFRSGDNPIEAVRIAIADEIVRSLSKYKNSLAFKSISGFASYNTPTTVLLSYNSNEITSSWIIEQNRWKLNKISSLKLTDPDSKKGFSSDQRIKTTVLLDAFHPSSNAESNGFGFELTYGINFYLYAAVHKYSHLAYATEYDYDKSMDVIAKEKYIGYTNLAFGAGYKFPYQIQRFYIVPFAQAYFGMNTGIASAFTGGIKYGCNLEYKLKSNKYILFQMSMSPRKITGDWGVLDDYEYDGLYDEGAKITGFNLGVGLRF